MTQPNQGVQPKAASPREGSAKYETARRDFETLEATAELNDQVDLDALRLNLMRNPTKALAASMYETGIRLWFAEHRDGIANDFPAIARRHGIIQ